MSTSKLKDWADAVKSRDGKCMDCGSINDLHAHHIKPKSSHPDLRLAVDNGKTLCYGCHKKEHERNRPIRIRSSRPQRRVLLARIESLEEIVREQTAIIRSLRQKANECQRGSCASALALIRRHAHAA